MIIALKIIRIVGCILIGCVISMLIMKKSNEKALEELEE